MKRTLRRQLYYYAVQNNPDLLLTLLDQQQTISGWLEQKTQSVTWLLEQLQAEGKPAYIVEEVCLEELTRELRPSRFNYISKVFEEEFTTAFYHLKENGVLMYETINILNACQPVFNTIPLTEENEDYRLLHYAVAGTIQEYLDSK